MRHANCIVKAQEKYDQELQLHAADIEQLNQVSQEVITLFNFSVD